MGALKIWVVACAVFAGCAAAPATLSNWLRETGVPIASEWCNDPLSPHWDSVAFDPVAELAENTDLLLLGEEQHGVHEFLQLRARWTALLVARHGVRRVILEQGDGDLIGMDRWVQGEASGTMPSLQTWYWMWNAQGVPELMAWLREWNRVRPASDRVRLVGVDVQTLGGAWEILRGSARVADFAPETRAGLAAFAANPWGFSASDPERIPLVLDAASAIAASAVDTDSVYSSDGIGLPLTRAALQLRSTAQHLLSRPADQQFEGRDRDMAASVTSHALRARSVAWMHNAHVMKVVLEAPNFESVGVHVSRNPDLRCVSVGLLAGGGEFLLDPRNRPSPQERSTSLVVQPGSWNEWLGSVWSESAVADLRAAPEHLVADLDAARATTWANMPLRKAFDAVVFVPRVSAARDAGRNR